MWRRSWVSVMCCLVVGLICTAGSQFSKGASVCRVMRRGGHKGLSSWLVNIGVTNAESLPRLWLILSILAGLAVYWRWPTPTEWLSSAEPEVVSTGSPMGARPCSLSLMR